MKKLIILIAVTIFLTGCYNYHEIEKTAIIDAISIDYENNLFKVTFEIIKSINADNLKLETNYVDGSGSSIVDAFNNTEIKIDSNPFFSHLSLLIINEEIVKNHFDEITDFILRNPKINNNIKLVASTNSAASIIKSQEEDAITSNLIKALVNNNYNNTSIKNIDFDEIVDNHLSYGIDSAISLVKISDNNTYLFDGMIIIDKGIIFNSDLVLLFNILNNNCKNMIINNDNSSIKLLTSNTKIDLKRKKIDVLITAELSKNDKDIKKEEYQAILTKRLNDFYQYLRENHIDLLGINLKYYQKYHNKYDYFKNEDLTINVNLKINKYGLVIKDYHE